MRCKICSKLTTKTPERNEWRCSGIFIVNFEYILNLDLVSIVNFEHVIAGCIEGTIQDTRTDAC